MGYSFPSLDMCRDNDVHFIDTDLPYLIIVKEKVVETISTQHSLSLKGELELMPLNVLNEKNFKDIINKFKQGPITIINEGLLMYLNYEEKKGLFHHSYTLKQRGGQWITADVNIKRKDKEGDILNADEHARKFREQHHIEENKFDSFDAATIFLKTADLKSQPKSHRLLKH